RPHSSPPRRSSDLGRPVRPAPQLRRRARDDGSGVRLPGQLPDNVRYVGPIMVDPTWAASAPVPDLPTDRPVVLAAFSSTFVTEQVDVLRRVVAALDSLPVTGVVGLGPAVDPADVPGTDRVRVHRAVPGSACAPPPRCRRSPPSSGCSSSRRSRRQPRTSGGRIRAEIAQSPLVPLLEEAARRPGPARDG